MPKMNYVVTIPGTCQWSIDVVAFTEKEAIELACKKLEDNADLEPNDNPEPDFHDAEILMVEEIKEAPVGHDGEP
jgi:hypothetical protein